MIVLTAVDISLLGEPHEQFGQTYWGEVEEQDQPIRFNLKNQVDIMPGRKIFAEEHEVRQGKNSPYTQLRKVKLGDESDTAQAEVFEEETPAQEATAGYEKAKAMRESLPEDKPIGSVVLPTEETPSYEAGTNARWALKLSTDTYKSVMGGMPDVESDWTAIEDMAKWLLGAFERLKNFKKEE